MNHKEFLEKVCEIFLEETNRRGLKISRDQLRPLPEKDSYRKIYLPQDIRKITKEYIHFEWLLKWYKHKSQGEITVGLHLEYSGEKKEINQRILDILLKSVNIIELAKKVGGEPKIPENYGIWHRILISRSYFELNEELVDWAVATMIEFYKVSLPILEEFFNEHQKNYFVQTTKGPLGKILITPADSKYKIMKELKPGDIILHYTTGDHKNEEYRSKFVGYSKVKEPAIELPISEIMDKLREGGVLDEDHIEYIEEEYLRKYGNYGRVYLVRLENYVEFANKIDYKEAGKIAGISYYQGYLMRVKSSIDAEKLINYGRGQIENKDSESDKYFNTIDALLEKKGQVILYGPPGTGKTWFAKKYVKNSIKYEYKFKKRQFEENKYYFFRVPPEYITEFGKMKLPFSFEIRLNEEWPGVHGKRKTIAQIKEGNIMFIYCSYPSRNNSLPSGIRAIGMCTEKVESKIVVEVLEYLKKAIPWDTLKTDDVLSSSEAVRNVFKQTFYEITPEEVERLFQLIGKEMEAKYAEQFEEIRTFTSHEFVTFHPSYSYEDFMEGIKPKVVEDDETGRKELIFEVENGVFKRMCKDAYNVLLNHARIEKEWVKSVPQLTDDERKKVFEILRSGNFPKFYLIIDEINRGDIAKIFGELITLLEKDKRLFEESETVTTLPYSKATFGIPPNLYIIGTMNTADRSIALIDVALRRRFAFIEIMPDHDILRKELIDKAEGEAKELLKTAVSALESLNRKIKAIYDRDHQIGHSYYFRLKGSLNNKEALTRDLKHVWFSEILPLLQEYFYDSPDKLKGILNYSQNESFIKEANENYVEFYTIDEVSDGQFKAILRNLANSGGELNWQL